jgi:gamma-glutamyltranspeptidase/glutathione hydrolase
MASPDPPTAADTRSWLAPRETKYGRRHAVSSGHYLASAAAAAILSAGGNAIDAGCCAGMALAVLHADEVNFAGVAPIMIRTAEGETVTIDGLGVWPAGLPADLFMREHDGEIPKGLLRTVVPAAPDAWITALREYGTMSFGQVADAARRIAAEGFAVFPLLADGIAMRARGYARWESNAAIYLPGGRPPRVGERFLQHDLARTISIMIEAETAAAGGSGLGSGSGSGSGLGSMSTAGRASGRGRVAGLEAARAAFYDGPISRRIVEYHARHGGYLTAEDMAVFRCRIEAPTSTLWRGLEVLTCGPWCQGPTLAQTLLILEAGRVADLDYNSVEYVHLVVEALKGAFSDREHLYGDPRFSDVPMDRLLSAEHAAARAAQIDRGRAAEGLPPPLFGTAQPLPPASDGASPTHIGEAGTSYVCVVDQWGNAFSATPSDGASTSPVIPGTGVVPSLRGLQSRPDPAHPAGVAPGKRPRLTPNPAIVLRADGSVMPFGCPGGDMQIQAMLQVLLNVEQFGMDLQQAINAPRFSTWSFPNSFAPFEYLPDRLLVEDRFDRATLDGLSALGHTVNLWPPFTRDAAAVEAIIANASTGFLEAGADPRQPAEAIVL